MEHIGNFIMASANNRDDNSSAGLANHKYGAPLLFAALVLVIHFHRLREQAQ